MSRASQRNALLIQHCYSPYRTTQFEKTIKKRQKGPVLVIKGPFGDLGGPWRAPVDQIWSQLPPIGLPGLDSWSPLTFTWYWVPSGSPRGPKKVVDRPTQLICISDLYLLIFVCQQTNTKDIAGQSANSHCE